MTFDEILGLVGMLLTLATLIALAVIGIARWANGVIDRHVSGRPECERVRARSRWS